MIERASPERVVAVIPAYRAAGSVGAVVAGSLEHVERVLVVDDGSEDGTAEAARRAGADVVRHSRNAGKGAALATAFSILRDEGVDAAVTLDADGQHLPEEIPRLLEVRDADLVLGVRGHLYGRMSRLRRNSNRVSSWFISRIARAPIDDVQTGFRVYRRPVLEAGLLRPGRFESESGVYVRAGRAGLRIAHVPVRMAEVDGRATSHFRPVADSFRIARAVVAARLDAGR